MKWRREIDSWFIAEVLPHSAQFRAYARRLSSSPEEAEDLVQEAYARALDTDDFREIRNGKAFVLRVVHNLAISRARRAKIVVIEQIPDITLLQDPSPDQHAHVVGRQELGRLEAAICALPEQCRRVVTLRKVYDMSPADIAVTLKISVSTVEKHLTKAIRLIAEELADAPAGVEDRRSKWAQKKAQNERT